MKGEERKWEARPDKEKEFSRKYTEFLRRLGLETAEQHRERAKMARSILQKCMETAEYIINNNPRVMKRYQEANKHPTET